VGRASVPAGTLGGRGRPPYRHLAGCSRAGRAPPATITLNFEP